MKLIIGSAVTTVLLLGASATAFAAGNGMVVRGTVTALSTPGVLTVETTKKHGDVTYSIDTSSATKFIDVERGGTSGTRTKTVGSYSDIQVGDTVSIDGTLTGTDTVNATKVMNISGPRPANGIVTAINGSTITIHTSKGKGGVTYSIDTSSSTQFFAVVRSSTSNGTQRQPITLADIHVGDRVLTKGEMTTQDLINATMVLDYGVPKSGK